MSRDDEDSPRPVDPVDALMTPEAQALAAVLQLALGKMRDMPEQQVKIAVARAVAFRADAAMLSGLTASCTLADGVEPIGITTRSDGQLVFRCEHSPPHEWEFPSGNPA